MQQTDEQETQGPAPIESARDAADWLLGKLKQRPVPKHQQKGPIRPGPSRYRVCHPCTMMFGERDSKDRVLRPVGVLARHWKAHRKAHQLGQIKAVTN